MFPPQPAGEQLLHQDPAVTVTTARFVVSGTTYPIRGLTAVQYVELPRDYVLPTGVFFAAPIAVAVAVVGMNLPPEAFVLAPIAAVGAVAAAVRLTPPQYVIRVVTAAGQIEALKTADKARSAAIVTALNRALAGG